jgi:hypothetical protein
MKAKAAKMDSNSIWGVVSMSGPFSEPEIAARA